MMQAPVQDHIKLGWLIDYLKQIEFLNQYQWTVYADEDSSESCIVAADPRYSVELHYDILLYIKEYTRPISELRRILLHWLNAANPNPYQVVNIQYQHIDETKKDLLISIEVAEYQQDIFCDEQSAEGSITLANGTTQWIKLDRHKPDELIDLMPPITWSANAPRT